jgi:hypothetical protein
MVIVGAVRIFDFSEVAAEVNHISVGGVFGLVKFFHFVRDSVPSFRHPAGGERT